MIVRTWIFVISVLFNSSIFGQDNLTISVDKNCSDFQIDKFRLYISNIEIYSKGKVISLEQEAYLLNFDSTSQTSIELPSVSTIDSISLNIGTDSILNCNGEFLGDLDPIKGMYWAWNTGFINWKLEGTNLQSNNPFSYHIGGYKKPFGTVQRVSIKSTHLKIDLCKLLSMIKVEEILIPGKDAKLASEKFISVISYE